MKIFAGNPPNGESVCPPSSYGAQPRSLALSPAFFLTLAALAGLALTASLAQIAIALVNVNVRPSLAALEGPAARSGRTAEARTAAESVRLKKLGSVGERQAFAYVR